MLIKPSSFNQPHKIKKKQSCRSGLRLLVTLWCCFSLSDGTKALVELNTHPIRLTVLMRVLFLKNLIYLFHHHCCSSLKYYFIKVEHSMEIFKWMNLLWMAFWLTSFQAFYKFLYQLAIWPINIHLNAEVFLGYSTD